MRTFALFALLLLLIVAGCGKKNDISAGGTQPGSGKTQVRLVKNPAPDFTLSLIGGGELTLSDFKGRVVLLDMWVSYCPICRMDMPNFAEIYNRYKDKGLAVIGVCFDDECNEWVMRLIEKSGIEYPVAMGSRTVAEMYDWKYGIPSTYLINRKGRIVRKIEGVRSIKKLENAVNELL